MLIAWDIEIEIKKNILDKFQKQKKKTRFRNFDNQNKKKL